MFIKHLLVRFIWSCGFADLIDTNSPVNQLKYGVALAATAGDCSLREQSTPTPETINFAPSAHSGFFNRVVRYIDHLDGEEMVGFTELTSDIIALGESQVEATVEPSPYDVL
jgi:hypothetical protein